VIKQSKYGALALALTLTIAACSAAPTTTPGSAPELLPTTTTGTGIQPAATIAVPATTTVTSAVTPSLAVTPAVTPSLAVTPAVTPSLAVMPAATPSLAVTPAAMGTSLPVATTTVSATQVAAGNTLAAIGDAQRALLKQKSYRVRMTITTDAGTTENVIEYVLPDRVHMTIDGNETIVIKDKGFWQKLDGGQWMSLPAAMSASEAVFAAIDPQQIDTMMEGISVDSFKLLGVELLDGKRMYVYEYNATSSYAGVSVDSTNKTWIGVADGLPYKAESNTVSSVTPGSKSQTTIVYEYDNNIQIEAPL
jgi:hypothetical protein